MVNIVLSYAFFGGIAIAFCGIVICIRVMLGWDTQNTAGQALMVTLIGMATVIFSFFTHLFINL